MQKQNRFVRTKSTKTIWIINCIIWVFVIILFGPWPWNKEHLGMVRTLIFILVTIITTLLVDICMLPMLKSIYKVQYHNMKSRQYVDKVLSTEQYTEIIPKISHEEYILFEPKQITYFAMLENDGKQVKIVSKIGLNEDYVFVRHIKKEHFTREYRLK